MWNNKPNRLKNTEKKNANLKDTSYTKSVAQKLTFSFKNCFMAINDAKVRL